MKRGAFSFISDWRSWQQCQRQLNDNHCLPWYSREPQFMPAPWSRAADCRRAGAPASYTLWKAHFNLYLAVGRPPIYCYFHSPRVVNCGGYSHRKVNENENNNLTLERKCEVTLWNRSDFWNEHILSTEGWNVSTFCTKCIHDTSTQCWSNVGPAS